MWWKKNKWKVIIPVIIVAVLAAAFYYGGNSPSTKGWVVSAPRSDSSVSVPDSQADVGEQDAAASVSVNASAVSVGTEDEPAGEDEISPSPNASGWENGVLTTESGSTGSVDQYMTDPVPEGMPPPVEPQDATIGTTELSCTVSISCSTILNNLDYCNPEKVELVPADGWILQPITETFYEGESVFNVLQRVCRNNGIHFEFTNTPIYNSAYIEGIANLYEFDVGELSGWMYSVNGWFPNYGVSRYQLSDGDTVCVVYTCDLGRDVGSQLLLNN